MGMLERFLNAPYRRIKLAFIGRDNLTASDISDSNPLPMTITGQDNLDAFGRLRVSSPTIIFDSVLRSSKQPIAWGEANTGNATSTHLPNESSCRMRLTTTSGDKVVRQTHKYWRYQPGKSQLILMSNVCGTAKTNVRKRWGYFDIENGIFFEQIATGLALVRRTNVTGSPTDTTVSQTNWNLDRLDGTGDSGIILDPSKCQIWCFDLEWLGVGRVRCGVNINGRTIYCHEFLHANLIQTVYMTTGHLPVRYECENIGDTASTTDFIQISTSVSSEGGRSLSPTLVFTVTSNTAAPITVTTRRPILTIRPKLQYRNQTNRRILIPDVMAIYCTGADILYEVVRNASLSGNTSQWLPVSTESSMEYNIMADGLTEGMRLHSGFQVSGTGNRGGSILTPTSGQDFSASQSTMALSLNFDATSADTLTVVATSLSGAASVLASMNVIELR